MLFKEVHLKGILNGTIRMAFRKWNKPVVREGSLIKTAVGLVKIGKLEEVTEEEISEEDLKAAGYDNFEVLRRSFYKNTGSKLYKIQISYYGEDPRIKLRENTNVSADDISGIITKLKRLDNYSRYGDWTFSMLQAISGHPALRAAGLSEITGMEKEQLKVNVRKLKDIGLTISLPTGYEISPLGRMVLKEWTQE